MGVNLDMTSVVEKQVKAMLTALKNEVKAVTEQTGQSFAAMAQGAGKSVSQIETLISTTRKMNADGSVTVTQKGYDSLSRSISEVVKNAQLINRTMTEKSAHVADVERTEKAYRKLTEAYRNQNAAVKLGSQASAVYWKESANGALAELRVIEQKINLLDMEEGARKRILDIVEKSKLEQAKQDAGGSSGKGFNEAVDKMGSKVLQMAATALALRSMSSLWKEAIDYAGKYYDLMNEIRIVDGKTQEQVNELGRSYQRLAVSMNVSSTEIAQAAVEFYRQGLKEEEVMNRLKATVQFSKVGALDFKKSVEIITAAANSMNVSTRKVADVLTYLGDASASGIDEVGLAMQKASASAHSFGLSMEWLGAYIATVSEQTRLAPEVIGTAMNSIISRLANIKEKGFNEEDATQINDVAKALATLNIELLDGENNWRSMSDIFIEIAQQWGTLNDKQRAYITTTMAGRGHQNAFLALMNDMAKGAEGGSRAFELYTGALNAAGTTAAKYAIWQESVAAAQGKFRASLESLYGLMNAEWMKGFYNALSGVINLFTAGSEALGGWNLKIPALAIGIGSVVVVIMKLVAGLVALKKAAAATSLISGLATGPWGAAIAAIGLIVALVTTLAGGIKKALEPVDNTELQQKLTEHRNMVAELTKEYTDLANKTDKTRTESDRMDAILQQLSGSSLTLKNALTDSNGQFVEQTKAVRVLNEELLNTEERLNNLARQQAVSNFEDLGGLREAEENLRKLQAAKDTFVEYNEWSKLPPDNFGWDFSKYAEAQAGKDGQTKEYYEKWKGILDTLFAMQRELGTKSLDSGAIENWFIELGLNAEGNVKIAQDALESLWAG